MGLDTLKLASKEPAAVKAWSERVDVACTEVIKQCVRNERKARRVKAAKRPMAYSSVYCTVTRVVGSRVAGPSLRLQCAHVQFPVYSWGLYWQRFVRTIDTVYCY
jgi:hypothetical protein